MTFDYGKLRGKFKEVHLTQAQIAEIIGISAASMSEKLNGKSDFSHSEIISICGTLKIPAKEIGTYFFTPEVKEA